MIPIYIASKLEHAPKWKELRSEWHPHRIRITARWIDDTALEANGTPSDYRVCWMMDVDDVRQSSGLIAYAEEGDVLRGALVEVGIALERNLPVFIIGDNPSFGTWQHHPLVIRATDLNHARLMIPKICKETR